MLVPDGTWHSYVALETIGVSGLFLSYLLCGASLEEIYTGLRNYFAWSHEKRPLAGLIPDARVDKLG